MTGPVEPYAAPHLPALAAGGPAEDWPDEARGLFAYLADRYGPGDPLPALAAGWIASYGKVTTRRAYVRHFRLWEQYTTARGGHVLTARRPMADAFARHLEVAPTLVRVSGEGARTVGPPRRARTRSTILVTNSGFYGYAVEAGGLEDLVNPFAHVRRPKIRPGSSPTSGLTGAQRDALLATARKWSPRSYALVMLLYGLALRVGELLAADVDDLGESEGHRVLWIVGKGEDEKEPVPLPPAVWRAVSAYLAGRTSGPLFTTSSGRRWGEDGVWKHMRVLARQAGIPDSIGLHPHTLRHQHIRDRFALGHHARNVQRDVRHASITTTMHYDQRGRSLDQHGAYSLLQGLGDEAGPDREEEHHG